MLTATGHDAVLLDNFRGWQLYTVRILRKERHSVSAYAMYPVHVHYQKLPGVPDPMDRECWKEKQELGEFSIEARAVRWKG